MNALTEYERVQALISEENRWLQRQREAPPDRFIHSVIAVEAGGAGDCFFYSLYEALRNSKLKDAVDARFGTAGSNEHFVSQFRNRVAENAGDYIYRMYEDMCHTKISGSYESPESFQEYLDSRAQDSRITRLIFNTFREYNQHNEGCILHTQDSPEVRAFIQQVQIGIRKRGNYIGQMEYEVAKELLRTINIYLDVKYRKVNRLLHIENRITLFNIREGHYQYFKQVTPSRAYSIRDTFNAVSVGSESVEPPPVIALPNAPPPPPMAVAPPPEANQYGFQSSDPSSRRHWVRFP